MSSNNTNTITYKKGDFLIDFGQVFKIIKIDNIKTDSGSARLLVFVPYFKTDNESEITSSLPETNLNKTTIRKPLQKKDLKYVLSVLSDRKVEPEIIDVLTAKAVLNQNDPILVAETIRKLYLEKSDQDQKFTSSKKYIYHMLASRLAEELALVRGISLEKAQIKIENEINK
jgi:RNA polymerase-interacting CarD/CdnL/TRCF family regulator